MTKVQAAKKVAMNRKIHNLTRRIQAVKKFLANLKNRKLMKRAQVVKKKANLKKKNQNQANRKKTKVKIKKMNRKLLMKIKRENFQRHNGYIKFICLKSWMELTEKLL